MKAIEYLFLAMMISLSFGIFSSNAIEVSLSSENGGDWVAISSEYETDADDSITEQTEASFAPVQMQSTRQASFSGNFHAEQSAAGSNGIAGGCSVTATGASGSLTGSATVRPGYLASSQNANLNIESNGEGSVYAFSKNSFPAHEHDWSQGNPITFTVFLAYKSDGVLNANTVAWADEISADINADTNLEKKAIILEPYYWEFKSEMAYPPMNHPAAGSDGDTSSYYLSRSGYSVLWYLDSAATREKILSIGDYKAALISSHMSRNIIRYSGNEGTIYYQDLKAAYNNPVSQPFVMLDGCSSADSDIFEKSLLFEALQQAVASGGAIAGWRDAASFAWGADSTGTIFEQMNSGKSLGEVKDYLKYEYGPYWVDYWKQRGVDRDGENQNLIVDGNLNWKL
jgi:hypothetical protein